MNLPKATRFKLNIMEAFRQEEERALHKSIWGAMIEDEIPEEAPASAPVETRQVESVPAPQLEAPVAVEAATSAESLPQSEEATVPAATDEHTLEEKSPPQE